MRYFEPRRARIEIIPMIDIMFFLLVFFIMITLRMIPSTGLTSHLPSSSTATALPQPKVLVTVDDAGAISVAGQSMTAGQLTAFLRKGAPTRTVVTIVGAKRTPLQHLLDVMDACRSAGVTQIGLAARERR